MIPAEQTASTASAARPQPARELSFVELALVLFRYRWLLLGCLALGVGSAIVAMAAVTPVYVGMAQILLEPQQTASEDSTLPPTGIANDSTALDSQVKLLASRSMARTVIAGLELDGHPEFEMPLGVGARLAALLGTAPATAAGTSRVPIVDRFLDRLEVARDGKTHVVRIAFRASSPEIAARIANGIAEHYIAEQLAAKSAATRRATEWLQRAVADSRAELDRAEAELTMFRDEARPGYADALVLHGVDIANLRRDLAAAGGERAARESTLHRVRAALDGRSGELPFEELGGSAVLANLYTLRHQAIRREAELANSYGDRHPAISEPRA